MLASREKHIILILDKHLQMIPWENISCLKSRSVSRMPSVSFLRDYIYIHGPVNGSVDVDSSSLYYVLNPGQDLKHTQREFEEMLLKEEKWTGKIAEAPPESDMVQALKAKDIFMYFGHGGAEQFIQGHKIRNLPRCATALLLGCSSGRLHQAGEFDSWGTVMNYLIAGSPAVVANLWDVTDKDLDRFSKTLLEKWGIDDDPENVSLTEAVVSSRSACILKYLVGAAPVVYGIPVQIPTKSTHKNNLFSLP